MKVRTDLHAGQAMTLDPQQLAQWAQAQMQSPAASSALASPTAGLLQLAQRPLDAQSLSSALQTAAGPLSPGQFFSLVGTVQSYLQSA